MTAPHMKVAILGQGCAGLASAYHLLQIHHGNKKTIHIDMYDAFGIGSGATGVAAGLIHPFGVSGKLLWQGFPAYTEAAKLVHEAQQDSQEVFSRSMGFFRPAAHEKQRRQFVKNIGWNPTRDLLDAYCVSSPAGGRLEENVSGFFIPNGLVIDTKLYLQAVWNLCKRHALEYGSVLDMHTRAITRLQDLEEHGYNAVIVATGAAIGEIEELKDVVQLDLCQGYTVEICSSGTHEESRHCQQSILGNPYIAFQGSSRAIIGATQTHGISSSEAFRICETSSNDTSEEALHAASTLMQNARSILAELNDWNVTAVRSGVRGLPTRTHQGSIPYAGRVHDGCWILAGLGARGLVYHAWLARLTAISVFQGNDIISTEYPELARWKRHDS